MNFQELQNQSKTQTNDETIGKAQLQNICPAPLAAPAHAPTPAAAAPAPDKGLN